MDELDCKILNALQKDFPLCERPFKVIGDRLACSEDEVWSRVQGMVKGGVIRRLGVSLDSRKLGYVSTLAAVRVRPEDVRYAAEIINKFSEVTHCYLRTDDFNIWFTLIASSQARIEEILLDVRGALSLDSSGVLNVPVERLFKLDACFDAPKTEDGS